jgi:hypothetical protein
MLQRIWEVKDRADHERLDRIRRLSLIIESPQ